MNKEQIIQMLIEILYYPAFIFIGSLSIVFLFGRMLEIVNSDRGKNILAAIFSIILAAGVNLLFSYPQYLDNPSQLLVVKDLFYFIFDSFVDFSLAIILYVTVGFRLYDRIDAFLTKVLGPGKRKKL